MVRQVASKTNDIAGDGTTTATVLTAAIFGEGCRAVAAGMNPMDLKRGIDLAVEEVRKSLVEQTKSISSREEIAQVATISANGDRAIGDMIANAMEKVGKEGVITVQEGNTVYDQLEIVEGMKFDRGFISPYFITDSKSQKSELEKPLILVTDAKVSTLNQIIAILQPVMNKAGGRPLMIIAEDVDSEALATLLVNRLRSGLKVSAVKAPGFGDHRKNNLQDIAIQTGATLISEDVGMKLENIDLAWFGSAEKVVVTKDETIILNGGGDKQGINDRCEQIRENMKQQGVSEFEQEKLKERLAKLSGGVAVIKVGGSSEVEVGEKKDRITDALNATKAAVEEGIVAGGGTALLFASSRLGKLETKNFDQKVGVQIIQRALKKPIKTIASNAGVEGDVVVEKVLEKNDSSWGYDASEGKYCNMFTAGIIDPTKVVKTALTDAASVASLMTTTEAIVTDLPKKDEQASAAPAPGGYGDF